MRTMKFLAAIFLEKLFENFSYRFFLSTCLFLACSSCFLSPRKLNMWESTEAELNPHMSDDEFEVWEIYSGGNGYMSKADVESNAFERAEYVAQQEGAICWVEWDKASDSQDFSRKFTTKETLKHSSSTHSNAHGSFNSKTSYSKPYGIPFAESNTRGSFNAYGNSYTSGSQEVLVTREMKYTKHSYKIYALLISDEKLCKELYGNKWRYRTHKVYYEQDYDTDDEEYEQDYNNANDEYKQYYENIKKNIHK